MFEYDRRGADMMIRARLIWGFLILSFVSAGRRSAGQSGPEQHRLLPTPQTVTWGYFAADVPPVLRVKSGDIVDLETLIAVDVPGMRDAGVPAAEIQPGWHAINREVTSRGEIPHILTGPIEVDGAEPGDILEVKILRIEPVIPYAVTFFAPGTGLLPDQFPYAYWRRTALDLRRSVAVFAPGIEIPLRPFFGILGVAPPRAAGRVSSGPPWIHAGNMDNKELVAGTMLYLPIHVKGALFSVGDGHAAQGDGEVCLTALETSLRGTLQLTVRKGERLLWPRAETPTHYITMAFDENLQKAAERATGEMIAFLVSEKGMSRDEAYILASVAVDLHVTQMVDGKKGVHAMLPKSIFTKK